jgi:hypothetical protein
VSLGAVIVIRSLDSVPAVMEVGVNDFSADKPVPLTVTLAFAEDSGPTP